MQRRKNDRLGDASFDAPFRVDYVHRIRFTREAFDPDNTVLREAISYMPDSTGRTLVFIDDGVAAAWPELERAIPEYARVHDDVMNLALPPRCVPGGERAKNGTRVYDTVTRLIDEASICRHSYVIAIGGGAVLDAVGFAASSSHRGVRLIRFPTTTLGQGDAGIGVKNGINAYGKKNYLGQFGVPCAVINDERFLATQEDRDWRGGLTEAVKVALLKDAAFFHAIHAAAPELARRDQAAALPVIRRSAELHLEHIVEGGDPFERLGARPLDFGHWAAHRLEELSEFRLHHGEAVAIGLALDVTYSTLLGMLDPGDAELIIDCLGGIGLELFDDLLRTPEPVLAGIEEFREHLGGRLTITLLEGIGRPVDVHDIDVDIMVEAMRRLEPLAGRSSVVRTP